MPRILFVDNDENTLIMYKRIMQLQPNFEVFVTTDANEAIRLFQTMRFDVVVTDYEMPIMIGTELLKRLRLLLPTDQTTRFIMITGTPPKSFREGERPDYLIEKPFRRATLFATIQ